MAFWRSLLGLVAGASYRQPGLQSGAPGSYSSDSAMPVTVDNALALSSVWASVKLISESIASLPIKIYKRQPDGTLVPAPQHPLQVLFNSKVNRWQTKQEYFETLNYQFCLRGNNYSVIQRTSNGIITSLVPLMSDQMQVTLGANGAVEYRYSSGSESKVYAERDIWHNKLFGNGIIGLSPLDYARNSIGIGIAADTATTNVYKNGGKPSGILTIDKVISAPQRASIKEHFSELANGNVNRLFLLEAGMQYHQVSLSPQDIELLASRKFQIEDIARFFGVPSVLINDTGSTTAWGSGLAQIMEGFYKINLRPYLTRYKASIEARLFNPDELGLYEAFFDFEALLKPSRSERIKQDKEAVTGGLNTPNECRAAEGLPPKPGGDKLFLQQQMTPIEQLETIKRGGNNAQAPATNSDNSE